MNRRLVYTSLFVLFLALILASITPVERPAYSQVPTVTIPPTPTLPINPTPTILVQPTPIPIPQVLAAIDNELSNLWPQVVSKQADYYAIHNRFFQGLYTHSTTPIDGNQTNPDRLWASPTDQLENWLTLNIARLGPLQYLPFALWMDSYKAPGGDGFVACVEVVINGNLGRRCQNYGPESHRTHGWIEVTE